MTESLSAWKFGLGRKDILSSWISFGNFQMSRRVHSLFQAEEKIHIQR